MATQAKGKGQASKGGNKRPNPDPYRVPVGMVPLPEPDEESVMGVLGWVASIILVALMLPLLAIMYLDNLTLNKRAEDLLKKTERLEQRLEKKQREKDRKNPDTFLDNPIFDRVRRPFSLSMPRPKELG